MHQIYPNGNGTSSGDNGLIGILQRFIAAKVNYHLFTNNVTITENSTLAGLTEAVASGYAAVTVPPANFTLVGLAANNGSVMAAPISNGTNTSGSTVNVYGYYVTDLGNTVLLAAANFDSPPIAVTNGSPFPPVVPVFGSFSQYLS